MAFASVSVLPEEPLFQNRITSAAPITIHLPGEVRIELAAGIDRRMLTEVLAALRASHGKEASF